MNGTLKTLKSIAILRWDCNDHKLKYFDSATKEGDKAVVFVDELQDAARGWIKEIEKAEHDYPLDKLPDGILACNSTEKGELLGYDAKSFIKHFFNLDGEK